MNVAVIPARGGSKRIPRKNIKEFCGKPIIAYSIEAALSSECFDRVLVSTDDQEIAGVAKDWGAEIPFFRPADLADDVTGTNDVVRQALEWLEENESYEVQWAACIYATAPFLDAQTIQNGYDALTKSGAQFAVTVSEFTFPPQRGLRLAESGGMEPFLEEWIHSRSQDLEPIYHDAGQLYWGRSQAFKQGLSLFARHSVPIIVPSSKVQDIDTLEDWERAELMYQAAKHWKRQQ